MKERKEKYNVIELEDNNKTEEEIKNIVNYQWTKLILKFFEKEHLNG